MKISLHAEDIAHVDWNGIFAGLKDANEFAVESHLVSRRKVAHEKCDEPTMRFCDTLGSLMTLQINRTDPSIPLHYRMKTSEWRTPALEDFSTDILKSLSKIIGEDTPLVVTARIGDALWLTERDYVHGRLAAETYLKLGEMEFAKEGTGNAISYISRAVRIAAQLDRDGDLFKSVMRQVEVWLDHSISREDQRHTGYSLLELMHEQRWGSNQLARAEKAKDAAEIETQQHRHDIARSFWELEIRFCERAEGQDDRIKNIKRTIAESYEKQAESGSHTLRAHWLIRAIEAWRRVGGERAKVDALNSKRKEEQRLALAEMGEVRTPFDATEIWQQGRNCVAGRIGIDAILSLSFSLTPPVKSEIEKEIREDFKRFPMQMILGGEFATVEGNIAARTPHFSQSADGNSLWLLSHTFRKYNEQASVVAGTFIEAARHELAAGCQVGEMAWRELAVNNPFVPIGREAYFVRGLMAGMQGDFPACAHLLIPQIENSIRHVVEMNGGNVTRIPADRQGVQMEIDLNQLLCDSRYNAKTIEVFGEDIVFDLRALLVEGVGPNLRNRLCHGLVDYDDLYSRGVVYLWWLTIHLCAQGYLIVRRRQEGEQPQTAESETETASNNEPEA
ncbi:DUF4209 domain-containing protein [Candidatus Zixiibacteriota bacterium]